MATCYTQNMDSKLLCWRTVANDFTAVLNSKPKCMNDSTPQLNRVQSLRPVALQKHKGVKVTIPYCSSSPSYAR